MGSHDNVGLKKFPRQGPNLQRKVDVVFQYDPHQILAGHIVRDDVEAPYETIIALFDGRFVRASEVHVRPF